MLRRSIRLFMAGASAALLLVGAGATAHAAEHPITGGSTAVVLAPSVSRSLERAGIARRATAPAYDKLTVVNGVPTVVSTFPITGGTIDDVTLQGTVVQAGGTAYRNLVTRRTITVDDFIVETATGLLTARVNASGTRIPLYHLDPSASTTTVQGSTVTVSNIAVSLTDVGARTLNRALGTSVFTADTPQGTVSPSFTLGASALTATR
jgi:hypothetical protein